MTEANIQTPVYFNIDDRFLYDANDIPLAELAYATQLDDADADAIGNQIAAALNRQSELEAEVKVLRKTLGTAQKAAKLFADTLPPKGGQAIARDLLETINETLATHGGNDD